MTGRPLGTKVIGKCPNAYHPGMIGIKISRSRLTQSVGLASRAKEISMPLVVWCPPPSCGMRVIKASRPGRSGYSRRSVLPWKKCLGCSQTPAPSRRGGELCDSLPTARHVAQLEIITRVTCHTDHGAWLCTQPLTLTGPRGWGLEPSPLQMGIWVAQMGGLQARLTLRPILMNPQSLYIPVGSPSPDGWDWPHVPRGARLSGLGTRGW